jgi:glycosyltransferase involved in cell wall biosynthesis
MIIIFISINISDNMKSIGIFTINSWAGGGITSMNNLIEILQPLFNDITLITSLHQHEKLSTEVENNDNLDYHIIKHKAGGNKVLRIFNVIATQIKISYYVLKIIRSTDVFLFLGELLILPMLIARIFRKKVFLSLPSSQLQMNIAIEDVFNRELVYISKIAFKLSTTIILYTPNLAKEWNLEKYEDKIIFANELYLDFNKFKNFKQINERSNIIGYVGRLSPEKGIKNFLDAVPLILNDKDDLLFYIIGDGNLMDYVKTYVDDNNLKEKIKILGSVSHDELPEYLNELKLLIMPSYTEGLPNIMLEAMACGTPVLASPVGSIPDIINDGWNGFIMDDNKSRSISKNVKKILEDPDNSEIIENAYKTVEDRFKYENIVKDWAKIFSKNSD